MNDDDCAEFDVFCNDDHVAGTSGPREQALREAMNYAMQYTQDGPIEVYEVTRTLIAQIP